MDELRAGEVFAGRFTLESLAGEGGMGVVWRARDAAGDLVALKIVQAADAARFARETTVLSELRHPSIVRYLAHGEDAVRCWVAMEWLEGEDLAARLGRAPLRLAESLMLARHIAEGLAVVHARGIVHRDVKPGNIFLPAGRIEDAKLLDFGVARQHDLRLTRTGAAVGTPGYMAPEQARGSKDVDARADVFSLGCVLFECIAGQPPFRGEHLIAVLAKVLMQQAPRLSEVVSGVPHLVDDLVHRMLAKDPTERIADGAALAVEIASVLAAAALTEEPRLRMVPNEAKSPISSSLSGLELHLTSIVLLGDGQVSLAKTLGAEDARIEVDRVRAVAHSFGANIELLADGSVLALLTRRGPAKDQAAQAARCALALRAVLPGRPCALATGLASVAETLPLGEAIDRVSALMRLGLADGVRVDVATIGLLDARFDVVGDVVRGERESDGVRTLLGKIVPCVGRDRELAMLDGLFTESANEPVSRTVVLTGAAGSGKSRVVHELLGRLRARHEVFEVWAGRGDPMSAGAPLWILSDALRRLFGVQSGEPLATRQAKIRARVSRHDGTDGTRIAWFLGEMLGSPWDASESLQIAAARKDPQLMADQMRRAFEDFVVAEASSSPVILVLEDLHWGDAATVSFVGSALRVATSKPLLVIATARPEVADLFPQLWQERGSTVVRLADLSDKAAERLVRAVLPEANAERVSALVVRAGGNALFLEELIRAEAEGRAGDLPPSVLAMVHARLELLPSELRRVLRAASVFGRAFWRGALRSLTNLSDAALDTALDALTERELVLRIAECKFPSEREYLFRHELVREAAYAMLTLEDRVLGHKLAAAFLEQSGEDDAMVVAEHLEKGGDPEAAVLRYLRATRQALQASDLDAAFARAERAIECGAKGTVLGELRSTQAECQLSNGTVDRARELGVMALAELEPGSEAWREAAAELVSAEVRAGDIARAAELGIAMRRGEPNTPRAAAAQLRAATNLTQAGQLDLASELALRVTASSDPSVRIWRDAYRGYRCLLEGDLEGALEAFTGSRTASEEAGDLRHGANAQTSAGYVLSELGDYDAAARELEGALGAAKRLGFLRGMEMARQNLGVARARQGALGVGIGLVHVAAEAFARLGDRSMEGASRMYLSRLLLDAQRLAPAEEQGRVAAGMLAGIGSLRALALASLARVLIVQGRKEEAAQAAGEAFAFLEGGGKLEEGDALVRLAWAEALDATGDRARAAPIIAEQRRSLLARAERLRDPALRTSFLEKVPEHAATLALARAWQVE